jgi:hypothetical protein
MCPFTPAMSMFTLDRGEPQKEQFVSFFAITYFGLRNKTSSTIP